MIFPKSKRIIISVILSISLLSWPLFNQLHYAYIYYPGIILLIVIGFIREFLNIDNKLDERFFVKWSKSRERGFGVNLIVGVVISFILMVVFVSLGQLFANGRTPTDILIALSGSHLIFILVLLTIFSIIIGIIRWHENENRYARIHMNKAKMRD